MRLLTSVERTLDQRLTSRLESHRCTARSQESRRELRFALKRPSWQNSALFQSEPTRFLDPSICLQCVRSTSCVAFLPSTQRYELFLACVVFMVICCLLSKVEQTIRWHPVTFVQFCITAE